jgi:hypothetical protein
MRGGTGQDIPHTQHHILQAHPTDDDYLDAEHPQKKATTRGVCKYLRGLLQRTLHNITSKGNPTRNGKNHSLIGVTKIVLFQDEEDGVMSPKLPSKNKSNITSIASKQTKQSN